MTRLGTGALLGMTAVLFAGAACAPADDACDEAAAKIATCFPENATITPVCEPAVAEEIASSTCEQLAARDGKADGWTCLWMPWTCTGGGGTSGTRIEVSVQECGGSPFELCPYVTGAACGLVTLHDAEGDEVARGLSSGGGRFTFDVPPGAYTVKVHERDGSLADMMVSDLSSETGPAKVGVTVDAGAAPWARFNLVGGSAARITQCAELDGGLTVTDSAGAVVDRRALEWEWLVELERDGEVLERTRPLFIHHEASHSGEDENVIGFPLVRTGDYTIRFVRMEIPEYKRRPNPDYADLRRWYAADVDPIESEIRISNAQRGKTVQISTTLVDPLR